MIALSATLTVEMWKTLPKALGLVKPTVIKESPDKPNIFLDRKLKPPNVDIIHSAEFVYVPELEELYKLGHAYPVTLCYMPLAWCCDAQSLAVDLFGEPCLDNTLYAIVFSTQDKAINSHVMQELKKQDPTLRLVFCSAVLGIGFDSPCITRIVHGKPTRTMIDFVQQLGRAGRLGQPSVSVTYYNANDIAVNVPNMTTDMQKFCTTAECLRLTMLSVFGYEQPTEKLDGCKCCINCSIECQCDTCTETASDNFEVIHSDTGIVTECGTGIETDGGTGKFD